MRLRKPVRSFHVHPTPEPALTFFLDVTMAQIKQQLSEEENARTRAGDAAPSDVGPAGFILAGLEIEEAQ